MRDVLAPRVRIPDWTGDLQAAATEIDDNNAPEKLKKRLSPGCAPWTSHWICSHMLRRVGWTPGECCSVYETDQQAVYCMEALKRRSARAA